MVFTLGIFGLMQRFLIAVLKILGKFMESRGWRFAGASTLWMGFYSCLAFFVTELLDAVNELWVLLPALGDTVGAGMQTAKSSMVSGFLAQVNYVFPLDFLITCVCLYCSLMVTCLCIALFLKVVDWIGDLPLT